LVAFRYNKWSPPAQSNETSNGYFLERSHSAKITLDKSYQLCPEEEPEAEYPIGGSGGNGGGGGGGMGDDNENNGPPLPAAADDAAALKTQQVTGRTALDLVQSRPDHAQAALPRAAAPSNANVSVPRSSPSQFSSLHPNRSQQPPVKHAGSSGNNSGGQSTGPPANY
jgi:ubiquitin carboxyl-terminal hydrolase 9/24